MNKIYFIMILAGLTSACANSGATYTPIVDGAQDAQFNADLAQCQNLAKDKKFWNGDVKSEAAAGAVVGAVIGVIEDGGEGAAAGAVVGGLIGGADRAWEVRDERKSIVIQCMVGRGHSVVG